MGVLPFLFQATNFTLLSQYDFVYLSPSALRRNICLQLFHVMLYVAHNN